MASSSEIYTALGRVGDAETRVLRCQDILIETARNNQHELRTTALEMLDEAERILARERDKLAILREVSEYNARYASAEKLTLQSRQLKAS